MRWKISLMKEVDEEMQIISKEQTKLIKIGELMKKSKYYEEKNRIVFKAGEVTAWKTSERVKG